MATFDDYLREMGFLEIFQGLSSDLKTNIFVAHGAAFSEWLKLKNSQRAPGTTHLRWHFILYLMLIDCAAAVVRICVFAHHSFYRKWSYFLSKL